MPLRYFVVACIEIDHMDVKWNQVSERLLWKYAVTNILNEALEETGNHLIFNGPEGRIICLGRAPREQGDSKFRH